MGVDLSYNKSLFIVIGFGINVMITKTKECDYITQKKNLYLCQ